MIDNRFLPELQDYLNPKVHRYDIINYLAKKHHFVNYLEIGVYQGQNIRKVEIEHKDGSSSSQHYFERIHVVNGKVNRVVQWMRPWE